MTILKPYRFYPKAEIEAQANDLLLLMQQRGDNFTPKWPFDASKVADFLDLGLVWDTIPADEEGLIAARIIPHLRQIEINEYIIDKPQGYQESTIAHEIGHWVLHVNHDVVDRLGNYLEIPETSDPFVCRPSNTQSQSTSVEWQAQYFASCLLMPKYILQEKTEGRDLSNWHNLYQIKDELGVSISNLTLRLQDLGWIYIIPGTKTIYANKRLGNSDRLQVPVRSLS